MKLNNFRLIETRGNILLDREYFAEVDVETGRLWWKKITRRRIRRKFIGFWHFVDTGELIPGGQAENLARAWEAQTGERI
jgi:hypothetical protein